MWKQWHFFSAFFNETIYTNIYIKDCHPVHNDVELHSSAFLLSELCNSYENTWNQQNVFKTWTFRKKELQNEKQKSKPLSLTPRLYRGWRGQNSELVLWTPWSVEEQDFFVLQGLLVVEILGSFVLEGCTLAEVICFQLLLFSSWTDHSYRCCFILPNIQ